MISFIIKPPFTCRPVQAGKARIPKAFGDGVRPMGWRVRGALRLSLSEPSNQFVRWPIQQILCNVLHFQGSPPNTVHPLCRIQPVQNLVP